jgi:hypothetical protein
MKLRKAIRLAAAGAVVGAAPMMAHALTGMGAGNNENPITINGATPEIACPTGFTCDTANAITDDGFVLYSATDGTNTFYVTGIVDNGEGTFNEVSVVGEETNTTFNDGVYAKTNVGETNTTGDDFSMTATITDGTYGDSTTAGGQAVTQKVDINQKVWEHTNSNAFNTGFTYTGGATDANGLVYETFDINLAVNDTAPEGTMNNSFQLLETKVDGVTAGQTEAAMVGKTLMIDQTLTENSDTNDTFTQRFIQNEAEGSAVADNGTVNAGPNGEGTFTFTAGDTLAVKTLSQTMNGAAANFGLSDAADESGTTNQETGVDNFAGATGMTGVYNDTTLGDPFVSF